jgi:hypothetical protein
MLGIARFLYTHNPFYLLSVGFVLYGLRIAFMEQSNRVGAAWWLAGSLALYTLLLAGTTVFIVRWGRVWDDARTVALLVLLMFVAISVSFDEACVNDRSTATVVLSLGLVFAIVTTEVLIFSLKLHMPLAFRLPLHGILAFFFLYPLNLHHPFWEKVGLSIPGRVCLFPTLAGCLALTLLPAIHKGSKWLQHAAPWNWPFYPWSIFFFLSLGVCGRTYLMTLSFQADLGLESSFGAYYLVPFCFAVLVLLTEIGIVQGLTTMRRLLMFVPLGLLGLTILGGTGLAYERFHQEITLQVGSPIWLTTLGSLGYYFFAAFRRVAFATRGLTGCLLLATGVSSDMRTFFEWEPTQGWPLVLMSFWQIIRLTQVRCANRFLLACASALLAGCIYLRGTPFTDLFGAIPLHVFVVSLLIAGFAFADPLAQILRRLNPILLTSMVLCAISLGHSQSIPRSSVEIYAVVLSMLVGFAWFLNRGEFWKLAMLTSVLVTVASMFLWRTADVPGMMPARAARLLVLGAGFFVVAGVISAMKGGAADRLLVWWKAEWHDLKNEWSRLY